MITLQYKTDKEHQKFTAIESIERHIHSESLLPDVLAAMQAFLAAVGYGFNEGDEIVVEESVKHEPET